MNSRNATIARAAAKDAGKYHQRGDAVLRDQALTQLDNVIWQFDGRRRMPDNALAAVSDLEAARAWAA